MDSAEFPSKTMGPLLWTIQPKKSPGVHHFKNLGLKLRLLGWEQKGPLWEKLSLHEKQ